MLRATRLSLRLSLRLSPTLSRFAMHTGGRKFRSSAFLFKQSNFDPEVRKKLGIEELSDSKISEILEDEKVSLEELLELQERGVPTRALKRLSQSLDQPDAQPVSDADFNIPNPVGQMPLNKILELHRLATVGEGDSPYVQARKEELLLLLSFSRMVPKGQPIQFPDSISVKPSDSEDQLQAKLNEMKARVATLEPEEEKDDDIMESHRDTSTTAYESTTSEGDVENSLDFTDDADADAGAVSTQSEFWNRYGASLPDQDPVYVPTIREVRRLAKRDKLKWHEEQLRKQEMEEEEGGNFVSVPERRRFYNKRKCVLKGYYPRNRTQFIDVTDVTTLSRFVNEQGRIMNKRDNKLCGVKQRQVEKTIKAARQLGLMAYTDKWPHQKTAFQQKDVLRVPGKMN